MDRREALTWAVGFTSFAGGMLAHKLASPDNKCMVADTPLDDVHLYLCAFHVGKDDPTLQIEAHHYCIELTPELSQCIIFESNQPKARVLGIEYIVSNRVYQQFSADEKKYWHSHDYEVKSGLLVAPKLSQHEENKAMKNIKSTWGKTFHTWADPSKRYPLGEPILMDAFKKDGEIYPELIKQRDHRLKISTPEIRRQRSKL